MYIKSGFSRIIKLIEKNTIKQIKILKKVVTKAKNDMYKEKYA